MKQFITRVLFVIVSILIGITTCEFFLRIIPNDYSFKNEWLSKNANSIRILNMGSSHAFFGIEPNLFSCKAFNAAHVSQSIKYDHFIFSKFAKDMDSLEVLILPVSIFSFVSNGPEDGIEDWRVKYYSIYYHCDYHRFEPKYNLEVYDLHIKDVLYSILGKANHRTCNDLGRGTTYKLDNRSIDWKESGAISAKRHTIDEIDMNLVEKNKKMIEEIVDNCAEKNVQVVLLTTPTYYTYRENLNRNQLKIMEECCDYFIMRYDNVCYLNLLADDRFYDDDFYDADHLNEFGAAKLTLILQQTIDTLLLRK
ncbi:MAG: hypothetical protein IKQ94_00910 [Bacteroidales bacterium]|nr:hypothetical protein [Bacteroidales bacterium]